MSLSIIIVNYKTRELIENCLDSILKYTRNISFNVIVVDNDSNDGTGEMLRLSYPEVSFIQMGYNSGFARANNAGIRQSTADVVLLLNSDTLQTDDSIEKCYLSFIRSSYVACGVQLLHEDLSPQISGNYFMRGSLNNLLPLPYVGVLLKKVAMAFKIKRTNVPKASGIVEVDWINGAFLMVKRSAIEQTGLMDEDFFLYAEEAEWCSRLQKAGRLCIFGDHQTIHLEGSSANSEFGAVDKGYFSLYDKKGLQIMLSNFIRIRKQYGLGWFLFHFLVHVITIPLFGAGLLIEKIIYRDKSRYSFFQWKGFVRNIFILGGYLPKMISNKPYFYKV